MFNCNEVINRMQTRMDGWAEAPSSTNLLNNAQGYQQEEKRNKSEHKAAEAVACFVWFSLPLPCSFCVSTLVRDV